MVADPIATPLSVGPDEKASNVMVYTHQGMTWGEVISKSQIRVSTWLKTSSAPDYLNVNNAKFLPIVAGADTKPLSFPAVHIHVSEVLAFHLMPPSTDPLDYDPNEPNLSFENVSFMTAGLRIDAQLRLSVKVNLARYLEISHETFTSLYNAVIYSPFMPAMGQMKCPMVLVREHASLICRRPL